jgi:hypothetical protein
MRQQPCICFVSEPCSCCHACCSACYCSKHNPVPLLDPIQRYLRLSEAETEHATLLEGVLRYISKQAVHWVAPIHFADKECNLGSGLNRMALAIHPTAPCSCSLVNSVCPKQDERNGCCIKVYKYENVCSGRLYCLHNKKRVTTPSLSYSNSSHLLAFLALGKLLGVKSTDCQVWTEVVLVVIIVIDIVSFIFVSDNLTVSPTSASVTYISTDRMQC